MSMERLLARLRHLCEKAGGCAERICATALLGQLLAQHLQWEEAEDPRATTRRQLLEDGVPIRCAKRQGCPAATKPKGAYINHMQKVEGERRGRGEVLA